MLKVGLTGGIGSGKSTVCDYFRELGVAIIDTDELARDVVAPGSKGLTMLAATFGDAICRPDGSLDRSRLREIVFHDTQKRQLLENCLHPLIREQLNAALARLSVPYVVIAIPLLLEKQWQDAVDRILVVDCSEAEQLRRAMRRDGSSEALIEKIMQTQVDRNTRVAAADDIIHNDGDLQTLRLQVEKIHQYYSRLADSQPSD